MRGAGKIYGYTPSAPKSNTRVKNTKKKQSTLKKLKEKYGLKKAQRKLMKTLKRQIVELEEDTSDVGILKNFLKAKQFIKLFLKQYDTVMNSENEDKRLNYSVFATILASNLLDVVKDYDRIVDNEDLQHLNNNAVIEEPDEFLENFIDFIEEDDTAEDFAKIAIKYFKESRPNRMEANNKNYEDLEEDYKEYQGFLEDTVKAVTSTIKEYSLDEKIKQKMENNANINSLISGFSAMKFKGANNSLNNVVKENIMKNNKLDEDLYRMFNKLGL